MAEVGDALVDDQVGEAVAGVPSRIIGGGRTDRRGVDIVLDALGITRGDRIRWPGSAVQGRFPGASRGRE